MFECKRCDILEARIDALLNAAAEERKLVRESAERERAEWAKERNLLLARIQAWSPEDVGAPSSTQEKSLPDDLRESPEDDLSKLREEGFEVTLDGTIVDKLNGTPWESTQDAREWRQYCKRNGLRLETDPRKHFSGNS